MLRRLCIAIGIASLLAVLDSAQAQEPSWSGPVFASPTQREEIERTDIRLRAYRPFHFYGNTVRRMYYRGNPWPSLRDLNEATRALMPSQPEPRPAF